jgi:hypothetical protein
MVPPPVSVVFAEQDPTTPLDFPRHVTCPEHRFLVMERAKREIDGRDYARRHGRPDGWGETEPERTRKALRELIDRMAESVPEQAAEIEAKARAKGLL